MKKLVKNNIEISASPAVAPDFINNTVRFDEVTDGVKKGTDRYIPDLWERFNKKVSGNGLTVINDCCIEALHEMEEFKDFELIDK
jgi:hypothetical protein